ncbi:MAG: ferrous iron transport protein B [Calditrichaeota bacterium]|nr:ferrous iron transport protein B [Calditrichota bacterium]
MHGNIITEDKRTYTIALVGNPNAGKTTIFNNLTGAHQHVGNYPGVTVEKKEGSFTSRGVTFHVIDLPGTYSLTAQSADERITRDFIINEKPDVVIDIADYSNLQRNLYLTTQLIELQTPLLLVLNMADVAKSRGIEHELPLLSDLLGCSVLEVVGHHNNDRQKLIDAIISAIHTDKPNPAVKVNYGKDIESEISKLTDLIGKNGFDPEKTNKRWLAVKLIEHDADVISSNTNLQLSAAVEKSTNRIRSLDGDSPEIIIAERRYGFIAGVIRETTLSTSSSRQTISEDLDKVLTNRYFGIPIFMVLMYLVFQLTFTLGSYPMGWIESFFGWSSEAISGWWELDSTSLLRSLLVDGIIGGVGGVIVFLPNIVFLFLAIAILEDTGYMPRAAFIMDRLMHKLGLHGKSFIPMLIGFGCSIPAIMATRTLDTRRERLITMLIAPLMSCGARLPIYALIIPAFFPMKMHGVMLWSIYMIGIALAVVSAKLLRISFFKGPSMPFVMELPPYRMPTLKALTIHMWERSWLYLKKAGTVILGISIIMWALTTFPVERIGDSSENDLSESYAGQIGRTIEPVIAPMGFDWKIGTALIGAFAAKEVFVSQLGIVYSVGDSNEGSAALRDKLQKKYNPLIGFCIMLFTLIAAPCMATIAVTKRESNSWKWAALQFFGLTVLAYVLTVSVYQIGKLLSIGVA